MPDMPSPLLIQPNDRGDAFWLRDPASRSGHAVATVWIAADPEHTRETAVAMAHVRALVDLAQTVATLPGKNPIIRQAVQILDAMRQASEQLGNDLSTREGSDGPSDG